MSRRTFIGAAAVALGLILTGTLALPQSQAPTEGPAVGETPAWFLQGSFPDPGGRTVVDPGGLVTVPPRGGSGSLGAPVAAGTPAAVTRPFAVTGSRGRPDFAARAETNVRLPSCTYVLPPALAVSPRSPSIRNLGLSARRRPEAAAVQVRSELQACPSGQPRRDQLPGQGARLGRRARDNVWITAANGTVMKLSRGQAPHDDRRERTQGRLE